MKTSGPVAYAALTLVATMYSGSAGAAPKTVDNRKLYACAENVVAARGPQGKDVLYLVIPDGNQFEFSAWRWKKGDPVESAAIRIGAKHDPDGEPDIRIFISRFDPDSRTHRENLEFQLNVADKTKLDDASEGSYNRPDVDVTALKTAAYGMLHDLSGCMADAVRPRPPRHKFEGHPPAEISVPG